MLLGQGYLRAAMIALSGNPLPTPTAGDAERLAGRRLYYYGVKVVGEFSKPDDDPWFKVCSRPRPGGRGEIGGGF